jgi:outer membrane protein assembly factor BamE (lipoprotein component of BamABCDE complex)
MLLKRRVSLVNIRQGSVLPALILIVGCSAKQHQADVDQGGDKMTVGTVQKEIRIGMSGADVAAVLGSPNVVTTDEARREVWMYDKMSRTTAYSKSDAGATILVLGFGSSTGAESTSQRTLTVIIKFDENKKVRDFAYHSSSF